METAANVPAQVADYHAIASEWLEQGKNVYDVQDELVAMGLTYAEATSITNEVRGITPTAEESYSGNGQRNMLVGGLWCLGGILVTAVTYANASSGGGRYVVAWGAIVFGAVQFFKGLANLNSE